jgi:hypothetical protein
MVFREKLPNREVIFVYLSVCDMVSAPKLQLYTAIFYVIRAVTVNNSNFLGLMLHSLVDVSQSFGGT